MGKRTAGPSYTPPFSQAASSPAQGMSPGPLTPAIQARRSLNSLTSSASEQYQDLSDYELVSQLQDPAAFGEFYERSCERVLKFVAHRYWRPDMPDAVQDLTEKILIAFKEKVITGRVDCTRPPRQILKFFWIHVRQEIWTAVRPSKITFVPIEEGDALEADSDFQEEAAIKEDLRKAIAELPPNLQRVIALKYFVGMTFAEVAKALGAEGIRCSERTAKRWCRDALKALRASLAP